MHSLSRINWNTSDGTFVRMAHSSGLQPVRNYHCLPEKYNRQEIFSAGTDKNGNRPWDHCEPQRQSHEQASGAAGPVRKGEAWAPCGLEIHTGRLVAHEYSRLAVPAEGICVSVCADAPACSFATCQVREESKEGVLHALPAYHTHFGSNSSPTECPKNLFPCHVRIWLDRCFSG